ncbi:hypothetical protein BD309DRAFT_716899 [Dichomitus squalens]|nr:hypothetical protein BD309DRAFT_716899 [Dichomitus squalens]
MTTTSPHSRPPSISCFPRLPTCLAVSHLYSRGPSKCGTEAPISRTAQAVDGFRGCKVYYLYAHALPLLLSRSPIGLALLPACVSTTSDTLLIAFGNLITKSTHTISSPVLLRIRIVIFAHFQHPDVSTTLRCISRLPLSLSTPCMPPCRPRPRTLLRPVVPSYTQSLYYMLHPHLYLPLGLRPRVRPLYNTASHTM